MTTNEIVEDILDRIMTNGNGNKAYRLVLELPNGRDGGGMCRPNLAREIRSAICSSTRQMEAEITRLKDQRDRAWRALQAVEDLITDESIDCFETVTSMSAHLTGYIGPRDVDEWQALARETSK